MSSEVLEDKLSVEEENNPKEKERVCRMFQLRICTRGKSCPNFHPGEEYSDIDDSDEDVAGNANENKYPSRVGTVCLFFLRNKCTRGDKCPFQHSVAESESEDPANKQFENSLVEEEFTKQGVSVFRKDDKKLKYEEVQQAKEIWKEENGQPKNEENVKPNKNTRVCRLFQLKICTRGKHCPDAHPGEEDTESDEEDNVEESPIKEMNSSDSASVCRFFMLNTCKRGDSCPFQHPVAESESEAVASNKKKSSSEDVQVCHYFLLNNCKRGDACPFEHPIAESESEDEAEINKEPVMPVQEADYAHHDLEKSLYATGDPYVDFERRRLHVAGTSDDFERREMDFAGPYGEREKRKHDFQDPYYYSERRHCDFEAPYYNSEIKRYDVQDLHYEAERRFSHIEDPSFGAYRSRYDMNGPYFDKDGRRIDQRHNPYREEESRKLYMHDQHLDDDGQRYAHDPHCQEDLRNELNIYKKEKRYQESVEELIHEREHCEAHSEVSSNSFRDLEQIKKCHKSPYSHEEGKVLCKYYIRGLCKRGMRCSFVHDRTHRERASDIKDWLKFCKSYPRECDRTKCRRLHISKEDEKLYNKSGVIGEEALGNAIRLALRLNAPIYANKCVCKDYLVDKCDVVNCPFLHYNKELFTLRTVTLLREEFRSTFGEYEGKTDPNSKKEITEKNSSLNETQAVIVKKLLGPPAAPTLPTKTSVLGMPVVAPCMPLFSIPPPPIFGTQSLIMPPVSIAVGNTNRTLHDKLVISNAEIIKENEEYSEYIQKLTQENYKIYKALNPEQPAYDLDEVRLRLLQVFEDINWKSSSTSFTKNAVDYQHKKTLDMVPDCPFIGNTQVSGISPYASHYNGDSSVNDKLVTDYGNVGSSQLNPVYLSASSYQERNLNTPLLPDFTKFGNQLSSISTSVAFKNKDYATDEKSLPGNSRSVISHLNYNETLQLPIKSENTLPEESSDIVRDNYETEPMEVENDPTEVSDEIENLPLDTSIQARQNLNNDKDIVEKENEENENCKADLQDGNTPVREDEGFLKPTKYPIPPVTAPVLPSAPKINLDWAFQRHLNQFKRNDDPPISNSDDKGYLKESYQTVDIGNNVNNVNDVNNDGYTSIDSASQNHFDNTDVSIDKNCPEIEEESLSSCYDDFDL